jgi:hypothetical protein
MSGHYRISAWGCSWCHSLVRTDDPLWPLCPGCLHRADVARALCDCPRCRRGETVSIWPLDMADLIARGPESMEEAADRARALLRAIGVEVVDPEPGDG